MGRSISNEKEKPSTVQGIIGLVVLVIIGMVVYNIFTGDKNETKNSNATTEQVSKQKSEEPAPEPQKIDVKSLGDAFNANQPAAEKEWGGKFVEFSAKITNINDDRISFSEGVDSKDYSLTQISCNLKDKDQVMSVKNEQTVTVRGVVGKQTIGVIDLKDCQVIQ